MPQDFWEESYSQIPFLTDSHESMDMFGNLHVYYDYEVHVFISVIFQKQCKHIVDYLGTPYIEYFQVGITKSGSS